ncbi:hypothetical protein [Streptomyces longwoodensis]|uniref:hypothetical protein n=1 Tax=Streptomyces longwoodensis TaxID=68231 RepID=UPI0033FED329
MPPTSVSCAHDEVAVTPLLTVGLAPTRHDLVNELAARALRAVRAVLERARPAEPPFADALDRMTRAALTAGDEVWDLLDSSARNGWPPRPRSPTSSPPSPP